MLFVTASDLLTDAHQPIQGPYQRVVNQVLVPQRSAIPRNFADKASTPTRTSRRAAVNPKNVFTELERRNVYKS